MMQRSNPLERIVPLLPGYSQSTRVTVARLSGGITNITYRVDLNENSYVVSINGRGSDHLGINRDVERHNARLAHEYGIGPEVVLATKHVLVQPFVKGKVFKSGDLKSPTYRQAITTMLRQCHQIPLDRARGTFSVFTNVEHLVERGKHFRLSFPHNLTWIMQQAKRIQTALLLQPIPPVFCHNDTVPENIIYTPDQTTLIDWEYSGVGDGYFDLAMMAAYHNLDETGERNLLRAYFGQTTEGAHARLRLMRIMSDLRDGVWARIRHAVSALDFDFRHYGEMRFARFTSGCQHRDFEQWLHSAATQPPLTFTTTRKGSPHV